MFQFHKGPIKARAVKPVATAGISFQFHKGPIKALDVVRVRHHQRSFNSIKVRLKPNKEAIGIDILLVSIP